MNLSDRISETNKLLGSKISDLIDEIFELRSQIKTQEIIINKQCEVLFNTKKNIISFNDVADYIEDIELIKQHYSNQPVYVVHYKGNYYHNTNSPFAFHTESEALLYFIKCAVEALDKQNESFSK